ncbi:MAG: hypothetical protein CMP14_08420 [Rickettsiales bacterium]|nr:hypothetical protein [Rickettsiales bacterium]
MSRSLSDGIVATLSADAIHPFFATRLFFDTQTLNFWTGLGELTVDGVTYTGTGQLLQISQLSETAEISAKGATLTLSGLPSNLISLALTEPYQGRVCEIYFGAIDANKNYLVDEAGNYILQEDGSPIDLSTGDPNEIVLVFSGYMDQMNIEEGPDTSTIGVSVESKLIDLERPRVFRYTDASQKSRFPDDKGFEYVEDLQDKRFNWGRA